MLSKDLNSLMAKRAIDRYKNMIFNQTVGNYTKSYETWTRVDNIFKAFKKEVYRQENTPCNVLDLGCGDAYHFLAMNSDAKIRERTMFLGIDLSESNVLIAREISKQLGYTNCEFQLGDIFNYELEADKYEIVLSSDVIEHLENVNNFMDKIFNALKVGGIAIITTPNEKNVVAELAKRVRSLSGHSHPEDEHRLPSGIGEVGHGHISVNSISEWKAIFVKAGFKIEKVRRGSMLMGGHKYNKHPILFAFFIVLDQLFNVLPFGNHFSEANTYIIRKYS